MLRRGPLSLDRSKKSGSSTDQSVEPWCPLQCRPGSRSMNSGLGPELTQRHSHTGRVRRHGGVAYTPSPGLVQKLLGHRSHLLHQFFVFVRSIRFAIATSDVLRVQAFRVSVEATRPHPRIDARLVVVNACTGEYLQYRLSLPTRHLRPFGQFIFLVFIMSLTIVTP